MNATDFHSFSTLLSAWNRGTNNLIFRYNLCKWLSQLPQLSQCHSLENDRFLSWIPLETAAVCFTHDTVSNSTFPLHCPQVHHLNISAEMNTLREKNGNFTSRPVYALDAQRLPAKGLLVTMINDSCVKRGTIHWELA